MKQENNQERIQEFPEFGQQEDKCYATVLPGLVSCSHGLLAVKF